MRKALTVLNGLAGLVNKIISIFFVFWVRWFFTRYLDIELLGLEGLFSNVLRVFSLVDAGFGVAVSFSLFKPIHENDRKLVGAIMNLYRRVYTVIGLIILSLSLLVLPAIPSLVKGSAVAADDIRLFFLLYALSTGTSYFFAYKRTLLFSLQKNYIVMAVDTAMKILEAVGQIVSITVYRSYVMYLSCIIAYSLLSNIICSLLSDRENAWDRKTKEKLPAAFRSDLVNKIRTLAVTNLAWIGINSTDNIIISSVVGVIDLAKNANYTTISNSLSGFVSVFLGAVSASIGDLLVTDEKEKIRSYFFRYSFIYQIVAGYVALGIMYASETLLTLWVGEEYVFQSGIVFLISVNIFLSLIFKPLSDYQNYSGLFIYYKPYSVAALVINLVVSLVLSFQIGIAGVFLGTTVTYVFMITAVLSILNRKLLSGSYRKYLLMLLKEIVALFLTGLVLNFIPLSPESLFLAFLLRVLLITVVYFMIAAVVFMKDDEFAFFLEFTQSLLKRILKRRSRTE